MSDDDLWNNCSTSGCRNKRRHPAAVCDTCLTELYGYGKPKDTGRLVEPVKTMTHLPKMPASPTGQHSPWQVFENEMRMKLAALTERVLMAERTFASYKRQPLDTIPEEFRMLQPFTAESDIPSGAIQCVKVEPYNAEAGSPRYCRIRAHEYGDSEAARYLRLGSVEIARCPQLQLSDRDCRNYVDTSYYALQYGAPVDWAVIAYPQHMHANLYLMNPHMMQVHVNVEIWCLPVVRPLLSTPGTPITGTSTSPF